MITRFRSLSHDRQLTFGALLIVALIALFIAAWAFLRTPYLPLFTQLREADAAAITAQLDQKHTPYRLADGGATILVPADRVDATRLAMANGALALKGTVGFELFNKSDMGLTEFAQRINYLRALQGELERTILSLDSVESCRVHLSLGEQRLFRDDQVPPKASVTMRMRGGVAIPANTAAGVQRLIAAAVPQLDAGDVVVLDESGQVVSAAPPAKASGTPREVEIGSYIAVRIHEALDQALPGETTKVEVRTDPAHVAGANALDEWQWGPADRAFPIDITVSTAHDAPAAMQDRMRTIIAGAVGFDPSRGDTIVFDRAMAAPKPGVAAPSFNPAAAAPTNPDLSVAPQQNLAIWGLALATLLGGALVLILRRRSRSLSAEDHARLAARLQHLLEEEEQDGAVVR